MVAYYLKCIEHTESKNLKVAKKKTKKKRKNNDFTKMCNVR